MIVEAWLGLKFDFHKDVDSVTPQRSPRCMLGIISLEAWQKTYFGRERGNRRLGGLWVVEKIGAHDSDASLHCNL
jgi:hypothetical protein